MKFLVCILGAFAARAVNSATLPPPGADGTYTLTAPGIVAKFIPYGATLTNLWVKDKNGVQRDIVLGYDNASYYPVDPSHPVYNEIPGRYANRIGNGTFTLDGITYHTPQNDGNNTLHSGPNNWSTRFWNLTGLTANSITFSIYDPAFSTGMPGHVESNVTYSLQKNTWSIKIDAISPDVRTPIMLTQHTYFNLDAYANPATDLIWNHTLHLPYSHRNLEADAGALPTGKILTIPRDAIDDFWSEPHQLGFASDRPDFTGHCGGQCSGYNGEFILDNVPSTSAVIVKLASEWSGITADLRTNQAGIVIYTCYWSDGSALIKKTQGREGGDGNIKSGGCIAIEAQDWIDGINHPEWGRLDKQIFGPGQKYHWEGSWTFGTAD